MGPGTYDLEVKDGDCDGVPPSQSLDRTGRIGGGTGKLLGTVTNGNLRKDGSHGSGPREKYGSGRSPPRCNPSGPSSHEIRSSQGHLVNCKNDTGDQVIDIPEPYKRETRNRKSRRFTFY